MKNIALLATFILFIAFSFFSNPVNGQCLLADYPFNATANDVSGNDFHGDVNGANLTTDRNAAANSAYLFDGNGDYITLNDNNPIITSSEFTISVWARMDGPGGGVDNNAPLFTQRDGEKSGNVKSTIVLFSEDINGNTRIVVRSSENVNGSREEIVVPSPGYNEWHHYVALLGMDDTIRLYIDGAEVGNTYFPQTGDFTTSVDHVLIGAHQYGGSSIEGLFNGAIDDVMVFYCAVTPHEIYNEYTDTKNGIGIADEMAIYPNPFEEQTIIQLETDHPENCTLTLYNSTGKQVKTITDINSKQIILERDGLASGMYFFQLQQDGQITGRGKLSIK